MASGWRTEDSTRENVSTAEPHLNESLDIGKCDFKYIPTVNEYGEALGYYHTALLIVGGSVTVVLYVLFLEQIVFICKNVNKVFRRHIIWITSVYPFMTLMSFISVVVPRADYICTAVKVTYMSIGLSHFTDLTTLMFGSEKMMLSTLAESKFNLKVGPACWCCLCFPSPVITKKGLRVVRWLLWQMPYTQAIYFIISVLLVIADTDTSGKLDPNASYLWLNILNFFSFLCGVYALQIFAFVSRGFLDHYNYGKKSFSVKTLVLVTKMQSFILDILALNNVFPCYAPYITPRVYKLTVENAIYLLEMMILGPFAYYQYRDYEFLTKNPTSVVSSHLTKERSISTVSKMSEAAAYGVTCKQPQANGGYPAPPPYSTTPNRQVNGASPYRASISGTVNGSTNHDRSHSVYLDLSLSVTEKPDLARSQPWSTENQRTRVATS